MYPESEPSKNREVTESLPAQEKVAQADEPNLAISAEEVYAQRAAESTQDENVQTQGYIP